MSDFGLVMLFLRYRKLFHDYKHGGKYGSDKPLSRMAYMQKHEPGEWFRFLAWAAVQKANRQQEKWNEPQ